jgi:hypothetical protein
MIPFEDLLEKDAQLIYEHCGIETLIRLWETLPSLSLYLGEKSLYDLKRRHIRKHYDKGNPEYDVKALAVKLNVSEKFVYETLGSTDATDDRQTSFI